MVLAAKDVKAGGCPMPCYLREIQVPCWQQVSLSLDGSKGGTSRFDVHTSDG